MRPYRSPMDRVSEFASPPRRLLGLAAGSVLIAALALVAAGCGGAPTGGPGPQGVPAPRGGSPDGPSGGVSDPITTGAEDTFNVTIFSGGTQVYIDKLEIEFNRRRGIHSFYGFYRDAYEELATVPFSELMRVDFLGPMPSSIYDQATIGREDQNLRREQAFELRLTFRDQRQEEFFAIIPKLRGEKDFLLWEFSMNNANQAIEYIEFSR